MNVIEAKFISKWAEGDVETSCKVNLDTFEVTDIESVDDVDDLVTLMFEVIEVESNGVLKTFAVYEELNKFVVTPIDRQKLLNHVSNQSSLFEEWAQKEKLSEASPEYSYACDAYDLALKHAQQIVNSTLEQVLSDQDLLQLLNDKLEVLKNG
ncbi:hypothetical protein DDO73_15200 [Vibrio cholerae]|nr:hypothetical protein [Vibrio cholerae]HDI3136571.1 hypothetical protein [Vibrio cholerae]